jgi:hypothetical protein
MSITLPVRDTDRSILQATLCRAYFDAEARAAEYFRFATLGGATPTARQYWLRTAREALEEMRVCHEATSYSPLV